jgi:hypothetical protein
MSYKVTKHPSFKYLVKAALNHYKNSIMFTVRFPKEKIPAQSAP